MTLRELERETKKASEPAKRWRNRYWSNWARSCVDCGAVHGPGEYWGDFVWPSKDAAETAATDNAGFGGNLRDIADGTWKYLGAFPEVAP